MIMERVGGLGGLFPFLVSSTSLRRGYSIRSQTQVSKIKKLCRFDSWYFSWPLQFTKEEISTLKDSRED